MSQAKTATTTPVAATRAVSTRRSLFGGAAAVVIGSGITSGVAASAADFAESPDAELIRLCAEFDALERRRQHVANTATTPEADAAADVEWDAISLQQDPMLDRIAACRALRSPAWVRWRRRCSFGIVASCAFPRTMPTHQRTSD